MMTYGGSPMEGQTPPEWRNKIMHARLMVGDEVLMGSDAPPGRYEGAKGISVTLGIEKPTDAERIFQALVQNGTVQMPIQETFWATRFGMLVDQFGIPWMINCEKSRLVLCEDPVQTSWIEWRKSRRRKGREVD